MEDLQDCTKCQDANKTFHDLADMCPDIIKTLHFLQQPETKKTPPQQTSEIYTFLLDRILEIQLRLGQHTNALESPHKSLTVSPEEKKIHASSKQRKGHKQAQSFEAAPKPKVKKLTDEELMFTVTSFFDNNLYNYLDDLKAEDEDRAWQDVQEVTMIMHKRAYDKLKEFVWSQLSAVRSKVEDFVKIVPRLAEKQSNTEAEKLGCFEEWFLKVHCSLQEAHPPSDKRTSREIMDAVLGVRGKAFKLAFDSVRLFYDQQCRTLQKVCLQWLKQKGVLQVYVKEQHLSDLASQICSVVSAMLLHSSPIIPFTGQPEYFDAYHKRIVTAKQDPHGRSELVYRTPYLYFYHYGELKTVLKAFVTFVIPPETSLPILGNGKLKDRIKTFFHEDADFEAANKKNKLFCCK